MFEMSPSVPLLPTGVFAKFRVGLGKVYINATTVSRGRGQPCPSLCLSRPLVASTEYVSAGLPLDVTHPPHISQSPIGGSLYILCCSPTPVVKAPHPCILSLSSRLSLMNRMKS